MTENPKHQTISHQTIQLVAADILLEISKSIEMVERLSKAKLTKKVILEYIQHLRRLKNVSTMLDIKGAHRLIIDLISIMKQVLNKQPDEQSRILLSVSSALVRLTQYIEFIQQKPCDIPQLLLPAINDLRKSMNGSALPESYFFDCDCHIQRLDKSVTPMINEKEVAKSRRYRQMYQIGLIEVIRQTNFLGGLKMMQKALKKLDDNCIRSVSPNLWWVSQALIDAYMDESLQLTPSRIRIFSRLDRQIKMIENVQNKQPDKSNSEVNTLTKEIVYLAWVSGTTSARTELMCSLFNLQTPDFNDRQLNNEMTILHGPSEKDYLSISESLLVEIANIAKALKLARDEEYPDGKLSHIVKQMTNLNNLLKILQVDDQIIRLAVAIDLVQSYIESGQPISDKDFNIINIVFDSIQKAVNEGNLAKYSQREGVNKNRISPHQERIRKEIMTNIKKLIADITSFVGNNRKVLTLKKVPSLLDSISDGAGQLKLASVSNVASKCKKFVVGELQRSPRSTSNEDIEVFADAIGCVEYFIETLEFTQTPSPRILEFANASLGELAVG